MINFFGKIRKKTTDDNMPMKYIRYAIGEILFVVIGILIRGQVISRQYLLEYQWVIRDC